jgi:hypothetical protein
LQADVSPDYAKKLSMEMHQVHSEPKESGHCDIDSCMDAALQGTLVLNHSISVHEAPSVLSGLAGIVNGAAHGSLSLACLVGFGVCTLSQVRSGTTWLRITL